MKRGLYTCVALTGAGLAALGWANGAAAQVAAAAPAPASTGLEDIIVTAQRRAETIQTVPLAITALSAAQLEARGVTSTLGLTQYVPNLFGSNNTGLGSANAYYIRGIGNTETIATFDPPVATYIDDIYLSRQNANNFGFFDLDRIEVLRGPQGTLFGRNTTGGAINVILKKPSDELGGYLEAGYGAYNKAEGRASINLPLGKGFALKLSGYYQRDDGYVRNTTTGQRNNGDGASGIRGALRVDFSDEFSWNTAVTYMRDTGTNLLNFTCDPNNPANCNGRFISSGLRTSYDIAHPSPFVALGITGRKANFGLGNTVDNLIYSSNFEYRGENYALNVITGVVDTKQKYALDFADGRGAPFPSVALPIVPAHDYPVGYDILNDGSYSEFTQEVKLNGKLFNGLIDYVTGFYYFSERNTTDFADAINLGGPGNGFPFVLADRTLKNTTDATAGYAQVDLHATKALKITGGIRYTDEKKNFNISDNRASCQTALPASCLSNPNLFVVVNGATVAIPTSQTAKQWTPRVAVDYQLQDILLFASATRGFKSGGWNARGTAPSSLLPFSPEKVWSYEAGIKSDFFDHRLRVNATAFWEDTTDLQTPSALVVNGSPTFITQNFAGLRNRGLELEVTARPTERLNVFVNFGYQNARYKTSGTLLPNQYGVQSVRAQQLACQAELALGQIPLATGTNKANDCAAGIVDARGNIATPVRTPEFNASAGFTYDYPIPAAGIILQPSVNAIYSSSFETGTANDTLFTGPITGPNGTVYPANPFAGGVIAGSLTKAYVLVNAALTLRTDDRNWSLSVECNNCFDKSFSQSDLLDYSYLNPPRSWMLRAKRVF